MDFRVYQGCNITVVYHKEATMTPTHVTTYPNPAQTNLFSHSTPFPATIIKHGFFEGLLSYTMCVSVFVFCLINVKPHYYRLPLKDRECYSNNNVT